MRILGIDTATWTASVGVVANGDVLGERSVGASLSHGLSLLPLIQGVLHDAGLQVAQLDGVAVSIGPGSFTGLRIGLSTAKGIAFAHGLPVVGVRTLLALAAVANLDEGRVCPMLDARKGEVYAALFQVESGVPRCLIPESVLRADAWLSRVDGPCTFLGDGVGALGEANSAGQWTVLPFDRFHPRGAVVAALGAERLYRGDGDDLAALEPLYIRPSEAELNSCPSRFDSAGRVG